MGKGRYKELGVNTALFAIGSFGSRLISFFMLPLYTALLSTNEYGVVDLVSSTVSILVPLLTLNVQDAVLRYGLGKDAPPEEILSVGLRVIAGGTGVLLAILAVVFSLRLLPIDGMYLVFLFAMFLLTALSNVLTMYLKSQDHVKHLVVSGIGNTLVMCVSAVILLAVVKAGVIGYMVSMSLGSLFAAVYLFIAGKCWKGLTVKVVPGLARSMVVFSAPLIANSLAWWINDVGGRYIVALICGAAANGIYAVAFKIPSILSTFQSVFYNAWSISAVKEFDPEDADGFLGRTYELYSGAMAICCSGIMLLNLPLAALLYSSDFYVAWRYVPLLLVGVLLNGLALFEGCLFTASRNTGAISSTTAIGAFVSLGSCIALTLAMGPMGAAVATLLGYFATWIVRTRVMLCRVARIKVSWRNEAATLVLLVIQSFVAMDSEIQFVQVLMLVIIVILRRKQLGAIWAVAKTKLGRGFSR